ncbi:MAG: hypothetical protein GHCLOJNM_02286 [bacterium]|nr:hypothetical protein [bacterium]
MNEKTPLLAERTKSHSELRSELEEMVIKDLLGPAGGLTEEIAERSVRDRYLVGMLAPRKGRENEDGVDVIPGREAGEEIFPPVVYDALGTSEGDSSEEGHTEPELTQGSNLFASSFGLTFCVDPSAKDIQVTARWGRYRREVSEILVDEKGEPKRVWKRSPIEGTSPPIRLAEGPLPAWIPSNQQPDVIVTGRVRKRDDSWTVTLFLVNNQQPKKRNSDEVWLFQPELAVESPDGQPIFRKKAPPLHLLKLLDSVEDQRNEMLYRRHVEFAVGHGVSVHADLPERETQRALRIRTAVIPAYEVPFTDQPTVADIPGLNSLVLDMETLSRIEKKDVRACLDPLTAAYREWIETERKKIKDPSEGLADYRTPAQLALEACELALKRIEAGIETLCREDEKPLEAFRFMNRAMALQRVHSLFSEQIRRGNRVALESIDVPANRSWRPFQLAFILLNIPSLSDPLHEDRDKVADLLWFPTGGGKTEAYLGLTAFAMAIRRLQGLMGGLDGEHGVAVLMRYTLRLLTLQQFQRASALMCACEMIRREALSNGDERWGRTPFRIGLWVGYRTTPNTTEQSDEAVKLHRGQGPVGGMGAPAQLTNCPWCGHEIKPERDITVEPFNAGRGRTLIYCGDQLGSCPFSRLNSPDEGLPVLVVDEEIYRLLPALLIATVDKFAQLPWKGETQMLFGQVNGYCERHGFRSPEIEDSNSHPAKGRLPSAKTIPASPLRPPDLIIQDELHLISGPLGSLVGLYETAIDSLCEWDLEGKKVQPKVIASTATIRRALDQVNALFSRSVQIFPPTGLGIENNFFALQRPPGEQHPGRRYIGVCAPGRRIKAALIRVFVAHLAAAQKLFEQFGERADPWMTLVGYFNSLRDLGGARRLVLDDMRSRLRDTKDRGLADRTITEFTLEELTSRIRATDIPTILDRLELAFPASGSKPIDVLLATNMVSVGVDVKRLGLMVVSSQPKTSAEYIQATSRVGRSFPGLVCTVYNWARPRDLSHYETFEHYHATFYKHVEALSVTPFSEGAIQRGLSGVLVGYIRNHGLDFNANNRCESLKRPHDNISRCLEMIPDRAHSILGGADVKTAIRDQINKKLDEWENRAHKAKEGHSALGYEPVKDSRTIGLLSRPETRPWDEFTCLTSLREVEPPVNLVLVDEGGGDAE